MASDRGLQCQPPCKQYQASCCQAEEAVQPPFGLRQRRDEPACCQPAQKPEQMRQQVGAFSTGTKQGQQADTGSQGQGPAFHQPQMVTSGIEGCKGADSAEDGRRGPHRLVIGRLDKAVAIVAGNTDQQHQKPSDPRSELPAQPDNEAAADKDVACKVQ